MLIKLTRNEDGEKVCHIMNSDYYKTANIPFSEAYPDTIIKQVEDSWYYQSLFISTCFFRSDWKNSEDNGKIHQITFNRIINAIEDTKIFLKNGVPVVSMVNRTYIIYLPPSMIGHDYQEMIDAVLSRHTTRIGDYKIDVKIFRGNFNKIIINPFSLNDNGTELSLKANWVISYNTLLIINDIWKCLSILYDKEVLKYDNVTDYKPLILKDYSQVRLIMPLVSYNFDLDPLFNPVLILMPALIKARYRLRHDQMLTDFLRQHYSSQEVQEDQTSLLAILTKDDPRFPALIELSNIVNIPSNEEFNKPGITIIPSIIRIIIRNSSYDTMDRYLGPFFSLKNPFDSIFKLGYQITARTDENGNNKFLFKSYAPEYELNLEKLGNGHKCVLNMKMIPNLKLKFDNPSAYNKYIIKNLMYVATIMKELNYIL